MVDLKKIKEFNKPIFQGGSSATLNSIKEYQINSFKNRFTGMKNENPELLKDMDRLREAYSLFLFKNKEIDLDFKNKKKEILNKGENNITVFTIPMKIKRFNLIGINYRYKFSKRHVFNIEKNSISFCYDFNKDNDLSIEDYEKEIISNLKKDVDYMNRKIYELNIPIKDEIDSSFAPYLKSLGIKEVNKHKLKMFKEWVDAHKIAIVSTVGSAVLGAIISLILKLLNLF